MGRRKLLRQTLSTVGSTAFSISAVLWAACVIFPGASATGAAVVRVSLAAPGDVQPPTGPTTKLQIRVLDPEGKPVGNASVYVRFYTETGRFLHHDKLAELDLKSNEDGSVKVPPVPQGKILIQVIAKDLHSFGKWYDVEKTQQSIVIKLEAPPHWY